MISNDSSDVVVNVGGNRRVIKDKALAAVLKRSFSLYITSKSIERELSVSRDLIMKKVKMLSRNSIAAISMECGGFKCRIMPRIEVLIPEENVKGLRKCLGGRFSKLVRVQKKYIGSKELVEEKGRKIKGLLRCRQLAPRLIWKERVK